MRGFEAVCTLGQLGQGTRERGKDLGCEDTGMGGGGVYLDSRDLCDQVEREKKGSISK